MTARNSAFTLIEMLIVIGIIVALAALLFAAFGPVREKSRERACASNLHQWGQAYAMYMADYDGMEAVKGTPMTLAQLGLPVGKAAFAFDKQYHLYSKPVAYCPSTHYPPGTESSVHRATSYYVNLVVDDADTKEEIATFGPEYALMVCDMHNADTDFVNQPSWATKRVQVLRLNQQVEIKIIPANSGSSGF